MRRKDVMAVVLLLVVLSFSGVAFTLHNRTLVEWWKPLALALLPACLWSVTFARIVRMITDIKQPFLNNVAGMLVACSLLTGGFYLLNYALSKEGTGKVCMVCVADKYSQERYRTKRISRNRVGRGEKYRVYYMLLEWPDGRTKRFEITRPEYARIHPGQPFELVVERGFFGVPVITNLKFPVRR